MAVVAAMGVLAGCSSTNKAAPPPTGGFSDTNLSGTYVFSTAGTDSNPTTPGFLTMVGTFTACGCAGGTISTGVVDMNDPNFTAPVKHLAITGGSYSVGVDGRGKATLSAATPFGNTIVLDFVLSSTQGGLVTEFDNNGSGSGTLDLQSAVTPLTGTYVFNLAGISGVSVTTGFGIPEATVGSVTLTAGTGTGVQDLNNNGAYSGLSITSNVLVAASPGTATLGALSFDVYPISTTHLKLIETDTLPILVGDVFAQTTASLPSFPTGQLAFTMAGLDYPAGPVPLAVGGMMAVNATGTAISSGVEDYNDGGASNITSTSTVPSAFRGAVTAGGTGRFLLALNTFENGANGALGTFTFAAYPSSGGTQLLEIDGLGITGGAAYPQVNTSFTSGQGYGLNLTGSNTTSEEDDIAEFTNTNGKLTGLIDVNDQGATSTPQNFNATYTADSTNLGRGLITSSSYNLASYTVDSTNTIFIEFDVDQVAIGSIEQQASQSQGAIAMRMAALRPRALPRGAWKKKPAAVGQGQ